MLTVNMNVQVELGFETPALRFADPRVGTEVKQTVKVVGTALSGTQLGAVSSDVEGLTARVLTRDDPAGRVVELEAVLKAPKAGAVHGVIRVATDLGSMPSLSLPVYAQVRGNVTAEPRVLPIDPDDPAKVYPVVVRSTKPGLKITAVTDDNGYLTGKAVAGKDGSWRVDLTLTPQARTNPGLFSTLVRLATNYADEPVVEISASRPGPGQKAAPGPVVRRPLAPPPAAAPAPVAPAPVAPAHL